MGSFSIGLVVGLAFLGVLVLGGIVTVVLFGVAPVLGVLAGAVLVAVLIILGLIGSALSGIFNVALYRYAVGEDSSRFFPQETLSGAFRHKQLRGKVGPLATGGIRRAGTRVRREPARPG